MTDAAKLPFQDPCHGEMLCGLLLDIEDIGMTDVAVEPLHVLLVGEHGRGDVVPFRFEEDRLDDRDLRRRLQGKILHRGDQALVNGFHPVDLIAVPRLWKTRQPREISLAVPPVPVVALVAMRFFMSEGRLPVVTSARAAVPACLVRRLGDLRGVHLQVELKLEMAYPARILLAMAPVGERGRLDPVLFRRPVDQDISKFIRRQGRGQVPVCA